MRTSQNTLTLQSNRYLVAYTLLATCQSAIVLAEVNLPFDLSYGFGRLAEVFVVTWLLFELAPVTDTDACFH